jgi:hypothetical protein
MPFQPLKQFNGLLDRMVPQDNYGGLLSPQDQRAAANAYRAQLASGLLSAAGPQRMPVSLGQAIGSAMPQAAQARDYRAETGIRNEQLRRQIDNENKQNAALGKMRGLIPSLVGEESAPMYQAAFDVSPSGVMSQLFAQPQGYQSPTGNLMEDRQLAVRRGDAATVEAIDAQLAPEGADEDGYESELGKLLADRERAAIRGDTRGVAAIDKKIAGGEEGPVSFTEVRGIRNDVIKNSADFLLRQNGYNSLMAAVADPGPATDVALAFGVMQILDPGSIVRENEVQMTANAGSLAQRMGADINKALKGEGFTDVMRADFAEMAFGQYEVAQAQQERLIDDAIAFAGRHKLDPTDVVPEYLRPTRPQPPAAANSGPSAGARVDSAVGRAAEAVFNPQQPQRRPAGGVIDRSGNTVQLPNGVTLEFLDDEG